MGNLKKILIVEDEPSIRMIIRQLLENEGYNVIGEGEDGEDGFKKYLELNPDLVLMDIVMPKSDGLSCSKKIIAYNPKAKIIILTALNERKHVMSAIKSEVKGYIIKPIEKEQLLEKVAKVLAEA